MRTLSFHGTPISDSQRRQLAFQQQIKTTFLNPILADQVKQTLAAVDALKASGIKPERLWTVDRQEKGTPCIAEWMGY